MFIQCSSELLQNPTVKLLHDPVSPTETPGEAVHLVGLIVQCNNMPNVRELIKAYGLLCLRRNLPPNHVRLAAHVDRLATHEEIAHLKEPLSETFVMADPPPRV